VPLTYQKRVHNWMLSCFGIDIAEDGTERSHRFLEEALELVQSLGCTASEAHQLVDYVFGRPKGEPLQELGGTMVTLAALSTCFDMNMLDAGETELARVWTKIEKIREKQAAKPKHSPLPEQPRPQGACYCDLDDDACREAGHQYLDVANQLRQLYASHPICQNAAAEIEALRKHIDDLLDPTLKSMRLENGQFNMEMAGEVVKRLAKVMTTWFRESGAKNYVEMSLNATDEPFESYLFYVQKRGDGALTPAEKAKQLEEENACLRAALAQPCVYCSLPSEADLSNS
jgi:hypothetical protein